MELNNKKVMVVGTGISGIGAIDLLNKAGADCIIYDGNEKLSREDVSKKLKGNKAEIIIGKLPEDITNQVDLLVISPGVPVDSPIVEQLRWSGVMLSIALTTGWNLCIVSNWKLLISATV
jgi:UDP-N-acetylmuramoylalanine--D-glutamate ligase